MARRETYAMSTRSSIIIQCSNASFNLLHSRIQANCIRLFRKLRPPLCKVKQSKTKRGIIQAKLSRPGRHAILAPSPRVLSPQRSIFFLGPRQSLTGQHNRLVDGNW